MEELEVEAVDTIDLPATVDAPDYVLYGGKGGVGKTTMAAATAVASAHAGTATLVVSTDPAHSLADTFERDIPAEPTQLDEDVPLFAAEIDPEAALGSDAVDPPPGLTQLLGDESPIGDLLGGEAMPGADEAVAMQQLLTYLDDDRFDRVVVDTAPTGHTLRLLSLPELMDTMIGRMLTLRDRFQEVLGGFGDLLGETDDQDAGAGLQEMRVRIERLRAILRDPDRTDFRIVVVPETMSVEESGRLLARLEEAEIPVSTIVVNRVMEPLSSTIEGADPDWFIAPDIEDCAFCRHRWEVQREALGAAQDLFRGRTVKRVPLFSTDVRGEAMLRVVAACLD